MPQFVVNDLEIPMVRISPGSFSMGSTNKFFSETPAHEVRISTGFFIGAYPITQQQWEKVMHDNPSTFRQFSSNPVEGVSWTQAVAFCEQLSKDSRMVVRLPSEAEWEYVCRAGTQDEFYFSDEGPFSDESVVPRQLKKKLLEIAWFATNSLEQTHPVGMKMANPWGLYDIVGNVWEWCSDVWHSNYEGAPSDGSSWNEGGEDRPQRVLRGGAWDMDAFRCRSTYRSYDHKDLATNRFGLRIVCCGEL